MVQLLLSPLSLGPLALGVLLSPRDSEMHRGVCCDTCSLQSHPVREMEK